MKEEMSSPDTAAPSRSLHGGPGKLGDGEGGPGFRCELASNIDAYISLNRFSPVLKQTLRLPHPLRGSPTPRHLILMSGGDHGIYNVLPVDIPHERRLQ